MKYGRVLLQSSIEGRHQARPLARIHSMSFELRWNGFSNHNIQFDWLATLGAIQVDLGSLDRGFESTTLVELKIVFMTTFEIALQAFGVGLYFGKLKGLATS